MLHWHENVENSLDMHALNFNTLWNYPGELFRHHKHRQTLRIQIQGQYYFLKKQDKTPWLEYIKNWVQGKKPISDLISEWRALNFCKQNQICAPNPVIYGKKPSLFRNQSLILISAIEPNIDLEQFTQFNSAVISKKLLRFLIKKTGIFMGKMHKANWHHRDCYLCHFLLPIDKSTLAKTRNTLENQIIDSNMDLFLIDWHRAGKHKSSSSRWVIKDLAGLYFSSKHLNLSTRDFLFFIKHYYGKNWKIQFKKNLSIFKKVILKGERLHEKHRNEPLNSKH